MKNENAKYADEFVREIEKELQLKNKHNKKSVEKIAAQYEILNPNLVKELTELAIVNSARRIAGNSDLSDFEKYSEITELYKNQVNLSQRTSQSILLQQYSTPAPIAFVASLFVKSKNRNAKYFEPSAGNGLLTIALPKEHTIVNEVDEIRWNNLDCQGFNIATIFDATQPFANKFGYGDYKSFDGIITNPPFGTLTDAVMYDGFPIKTLDHLMALRALDMMKDKGKAAIIIGGHTAWDEQGRIQAGKNRIFFNYLYSLYNVEDVILIDGHKLYSRQGTSFDVRLILIDGRKPQVEGVAPLKTSLSEKVVTDFEELWNRVFDADSEKDDRIRIAKAKAVSKLKILNLLTI